MNDRTQKTLTLIRDLAAGFVEYPEALRVEAQEAEGTTAYFMLKGHDEDESKLVGKQGCHVDALAFLISAIGIVNGWVYTFRLITAKRMMGQPENGPRDAIAYDPEPARILLARILEALSLVGATVTVGPGAGARDCLSFTFAIRVKDEYQFSILTMRHEIIRSERPLSMALIEAIGTLFRAIARKDGARFRITAEL
jgi:predicted RNA-binding protein YlqC (UPF0109 family)